MMTPRAPVAEQLIAELRSYHRPVVAFSGGVDSAVVARAAFEADRSTALAVTSIGPAVAESERAIARDVAGGIGIEHIELPTDEWRNPSYVRNAPDRCFHCKSELYGAIRRWLEAHGMADREIVSGTNVDDLGDFRPGLEAARDFAVRHPLVACGLTKPQVRDLARLWGIPVWNKPAAPCLASRVAYGVEVSPERLLRIERAESLLRELGFRIVRVRLHADELARIEVPREDIPTLIDRLDQSAVERLKELGFRRVTVDLEGFRSGNLNDLVPVDVLSQSVAKPAGGRDT